MQFFNSDFLKGRWGTIHPSVFSEVAGPLHQTAVSARPHGGMRYRCPINGSLILVTDETNLRDLHEGQTRLRCAGCGEMHLLKNDGNRFAAEPAKP